MLIGFQGSPEEIWTSCAQWWRDHGLQSFADALGEPAPITLSGGESCFVFPPVSMQLEGMPQLVELANYDQPCRIQSEMLSASTDRPNRPYALVLSHGIPEWTRGLTSAGLRTALLEHRVLGLSVPEYLSLQRRAFEVFEDHRFDDYTGDPAGWTWLPASTAGPLWGMGYYNSLKGQLEVSACKAGSKNPRKGAHICRIVGHP
ncbi:hypothetical protein [Cryobacterium cryoconiti]|uniref:Uncharacterized protein n=1 Tax=Cryobacterium cryoconiti TaxID=1259239 RepID=A0A4Y8JZU9_9MICO|nr:hypothetical protein [Cryobacterium cryoconiti]TFD31141.1 hypothetical protein E3T49_06360 [Cryobacterium cryoconiti]